MRFGQCFGPWLAAQQRLVDRPRQRPRGHAMRRPLDVAATRTGRLWPPLPAAHHRRRPCGLRLAGAELLLGPGHMGARPHVEGVALAQRSHAGQAALFERNAARNLSIHRTHRHAVRRASGRFQELEAAVGPPCRRRPPRPSRQSARRLPAAGQSAAADQCLRFRQRRATSRGRRACHGRWGNVLEPGALERRPVVEQAVDRRKGRCLHPQRPRRPTGSCCPSC
mmetsp:Transcript_126429/g.363685  ORF Transcript_126429/g.363685 Transcript_126429/m.363685 type:complete len:224 (-) Transcript_126429:260-931(-)